MRRAYVDANVILRFLTGDPPDLAEQARDLFEAVDGGQVSLFVDEIVVAETVWVLHSFYRYPNREIARVVQQLLSHDGLEADDEPGLLTALQFFADKNVDFADALVGVHMGQRGMRDVFSFDHHFERLPGVKRWEPGDLEIENSNL
ncbi:MAG: type II toxin-antitoxin system VapC family toxin [Chloroflexi bacterium]|nr:type II toxin-antitoxin system VapC family toxin [Chloroflexota bacterium]